MRLSAVLGHELAANIPISDIAQFRTGPGTALGDPIFGLKSFRES
jgi:hypothetical protein